MIGDRTPWVLKVGGAELVPGPALAGMALLVARQVRRDRPIILVHGGGEEVTARAAELGLPTERRAGQRVTTAPMLEVVVEVLGGRVNTRLVHALEGAGVPAVGVSGVSNRLLQVRPAGDPPGALGWVGEPTGVRAGLLLALLDRGVTPVVAPLGADGSGGVYNVNADLAAGAIASALGARLFLLTDVPAVRGPDGAALASLTPSAARRLVVDGTARDGMIPKLDAAVRALRDGAVAAWIGRPEAIDDDGPSAGTGTIVGGPAAPVPLLPSLTPGAR